MKNTATHTRKILIITIPAALLLAISVMLVFWFLRPTYTVTFMCNNWVVDEQKVKKYGAAIPPTDFDVSENKVFRGWDNPIGDVKEDILIRAILDSADNENIFTMGSVYCKRGADARVPLRLQGKVNLAGFQLLITYQTDALEFKAFESLDKDMVANCNSEKGEITIAFASGDNINGVIDICDLVFETKGKSAQSEIGVTEVIASQVQDESVIKTTAGSIPATVYLY